MGLIEGVRPAAAAPANEAYFTELSDELADRGFLVTALDELITWARTGSLMWMQTGLACCAVEMMQIDAALRYRAVRHRPARLAAHLTCWIVAAR